jgi:hypothetical protein
VASFLAPFPVMRTWNDLETRLAVEVVLTLGFSVKTIYFDWERKDKI